MRLGVVLTGVGIYGAAGAGVLTELWRREMEPYAVCALGSGAWPTALFAAGCSASQMETACLQLQRAGKRILGRRRFGVADHARGLYTAQGLQHLLHTHTGERLLALCPRRTIFPVRMLRGGTLAFASRCSTVGEGAVLTMQASAAFAARAAMGLPPFLDPLEWMGTTLLPVRDTELAARLLFAAGAQRVLIAEVHPSPRMKQDGLLLAAACMESGQEAVLPGTARLTIQMLETMGTLSFGDLSTCMELGRQAAKRELDGLLDMLGMAHCRVLPFRRS